MGLRQHGCVGVARERSAGVLLILSRLWLFFEKRHLCIARPGALPKACFRCPVAGTIISCIPAHTAKTHEVDSCFFGPDLKSQTSVFRQPLDST